MGKIPILTHIFQMGWNHQLEAFNLKVPSGKTNIAMENGPRIEDDVFPIEHGDIPASYVSLPEGT